MESITYTYAAVVIETLAARLPTCQSSIPCTFLSKNLMPPLRAFENTTKPQLLSSCVLPLHLPAGAGSFLFATPVSSGCAGASPHPRVKALEKVPRHQHLAIVGSLLGVHPFSASLLLGDPSADGFTGDDCKHAQKSSIKWPDSRLSGSAKSCRK